MESSIAAALIACSGVIAGAGIGGWASYRIARTNVKAQIKRDIEEDLHEQMVWLRRKVREHETAQHDCERRYNDLARKHLMLDLEVGRLRAGLR